MIKRYDDKSLLLQISHGDEKSFNLFFERYRNQLFTYLYKITKSKESAEEIVLDVFLKLWLGKEIVTDIKNPEAFLFRIARNKAIDFLRSVRRDPLRQKEIWGSMQDAISNESADSRILLKNTENAIDEAVKHLSPQRQKVYDMRHNQGMSNEEIAKKLKLSQITVRNHLIASLQFIRDFITNDDSYIFFILFLISGKNIF